MSRNNNRSHRHDLFGISGHWFSSFHFSRTKITQTTIRRRILRCCWTCFGCSCWNVFLLLLSAVQRSRLYLVLAVFGHLSFWFGAVLHGYFWVCVYSLYASIVESASEKANFRITDPSWNLSPLWWHRNKQNSISRILLEKTQKWFFSHFWTANQKNKNDKKWQFLNL